MPSGNRSTAQHELEAKLRQAQALLNDALNLAARIAQPGRQAAARPMPAATSSGAIRFDMNERAFVKRYATQVGGGPKKFVLLLAYAAKGEVGKDVDIGEIEKMWNRMSSKALLGMKFNRFFSNSAKDQGWVNSSKRGVYSLDHSWKEVHSG